MLNPTRRILIHDRDSARRLGDSLRLWHHAPVEIRVGVPGLEPGQRLAAESRIKKLYEACGCTEGSYAMAGAFVLWLGAWIGFSDFPERPLWWLGIGLSATFLTAGAGKLWGLSRARRQLREELAALVAYSSSEGFSASKYEP